MVVPFLVQGRRLATLDDADRRAQQGDPAVQHRRSKKCTSSIASRRELQTKLRIIQDLNRKRVGPSRVLDDLSAATPDNLWLIDFGEGNSQATVTGLALDNETIARFMRQLQDSPYFHAVDLVETSRTSPQPASAAAQAPVSFTRFIVKASIDYFGRDGKPPEPPPGANPVPGQPAAAKQEPKA